MTGRGKGIVVAIALGVIAAWFLPIQARATLGEPVASVTADRTALAAVRGAVTSRAGYTIQEVASPAVSVREYVSPAGIVFGVAWNGLVQPDLTQLLGSYAHEYRQALRRTPRGRGKRSRQIRTDRVVVETWGHMRDMHGRAYVPALLPQGVSVDAIK